MNVAFKHLEDRIRIGELTLSQWAWLLLGIALAALWAFELSPFGMLGTTFTAIYVAGLPALGAVFAGFTELDLVGLATGAFRWWRSEDRFEPGAEEATGYLISEPAGESGTYTPQPTIDMEELWR